MIDPAIKEEGLNFIETYRKLKDNADGENEAIPERERISVPPPAVKELEARHETRDRSAPLLKLLQRVVEFYRATFKKDKRGFEYLTRERGIADTRVFELFGAGYANGTLYTAIPQKGKVTDELKELGILTVQERELFDGCVVFPLTDDKGNVVSLYGRKSTDGAVNHLYLPGPHRGLFNRCILKSHNEIILTESILDSLSLYGAGIKNTVPLYGANGLTRDHLAAFKECNTLSAIILFDGDDAGRKGALHVKERLEGELSMICRIVELPEGEDPNSYLKTHTGEEIEKLIYPEKKSLGAGIDPRAPRYQEIEGGFRIELCRRSYTVRGIEATASKLKAMIRVEGHASSGGIRDKHKTHIDTLDFYSARARKGFIRDLSVFFGEEEETIDRDVGALIRAVEEYGKRQEDGGTLRITIGPDERREALVFGRSGHLIDEIVCDIERCGYVGDEMNKLVSYLAMTSRKMSDPLSVLIISGSGAGKTSLQDTVLGLCPPEELVKLTSLTGKALFYKKECSLIQAHDVSL